MKKILIGLFSVVILSSVNIGLAHADTNDFVIRDFQADYYLDKDSDGRSTLKTVELITAEFPTFDQNHGIERAIPTKYDGHSVNLKIDSVTDQNGATLPYSTYSSNDNSVLRIGEAGIYAHGSNTYKITYTQHDVTKFFADTNDDEFYWDTNGTGWLQLFDKVTVRLHIGSNIASSLTGKQSCYYGISGATNKCDIAKDNGTFTISRTSLAVGENVTVVVGFKPHTFSDYKMSFNEFIQNYGFMISVAICILLFAVIYVLKMMSARKIFASGTIIAEYLPPKGVDVAMASLIVGKKSAWTAATYIDLAVRHKIRVIEKNTNDYSLELITSDGVTDNEKAVMVALFGDELRVGSRYNIEKGYVDKKLSLGLYKIYKSVKHLTKEQGYLETNLIIRIIIVILSLLITAQALIIGMLNLNVLFISVFYFIITILGIILAIRMISLSPKGRELFDYLKGLKVYIKCAEADRLRVLQSPQGAEKTPVDTSDTEQIVHLYERVLPYAMMFGIEKEWIEVLGKYYEQQNMSPDWYSSNNNLFNMALFSTSISNFSTAIANNSYSTSSSSSLGGSGGGGFSGGGGGGGGGGGW